MTQPLRPATPALPNSPDGRALREMEQRLATLVLAESKKTNANVDAARVEIRSLQDRVTAVERTARTSERVREIAHETAGGVVHAAVTDSDLKAQAELAKEIAAREALAKVVDVLDEKQDRQLAILGRLDAFVTSAGKNPMVRRILIVVGTAFLTWATAKGWFHP